MGLDELRDIRSGSQWREPSSTRSFEQDRGFYTDLLLLQRARAWQPSKVPLIFLVTQSNLGK